MYRERLTIINFRDRFKTVVQNVLLSVMCVITFDVNTYGQSGTVVGAGNFLEKDGEAVFAIGAYGLPPGTSLADARKAGFNLLHVPANRERWDEAQRAGLYVWHSFGSTLDFESGDREKKKASIQQTVDSFAKHPALLYWESMDEPAWTDKNPALARATPEGLSEGFRYLKSLDANHPVYLNHAPRNRVETLQRYNTACDIVCADIYPIIPAGLKSMYAITPDGRHGDLPNQTPSCVGEYADKMRRVAGDGRPMFLVLQGFSWEGLRKEKADPELVLYPTYRQSRFMAYHAILHGVNGILYWGLHYVPENHPFLGELFKVTQEIAALSPAILHGKKLQTPTLRYHERGSTISAGIETLCLETNEAVYLIAVNTSVDPAAVDFSMLPSELKDAKVLDGFSENRRVVVKDGAFFDEFAGLDVHVYVCKR